MAQIVKKMTIWPYFQKMARIVKKMTIWPCFQKMAQIVIFLTIWAIFGKKGQIVKKMTIWPCFEKMAQIVKKVTIRGTKNWSIRWKGLRRKHAVSAFFKSRSLTLWALYNAGIGLKINLLVTGAWSGFSGTVCGCILHSRVLSIGAINAGKG